MIPIPAVLSRSLCRPAALAIAVGWLGSACGSSSVAVSPDAAPSIPDAAAPPAPDAPGPKPIDRDILATALQFDVTALTGTARIQVAPSTQTEVDFEAQGLTITSVAGTDGPLAYQVANGLLMVTVPASTDPLTITVVYSFKLQSNFNGFLTSGSTFIWPYFCGNLFPCHSNPADGTTFSLALTGVPAGEVAVYPTSLPIAPPYQIAWALGAYTEIDLGTTAAGTEVKTWYRNAGELQRVTDGTTHLRDIFEWYETKFGAYTFGSTVGALPVTWGAGYGGMEHHPYWHVATGSVSDETTNAHEAFHGWFGDGVRLKCWEDFVLSEGTVSYMAARAITEFEGAQAGAAVWQGYQEELDSVEGSATTKIKKAWFPDTCNAIDIEMGYFTDIPYMKGAFFYRALESKIGAPALDAALADFYATHVGQAARMQDLLDTVQADSGYDPTACAAAWLQSDAVPTDPSCE